MVSSAEMAHEATVDLSRLAGFEPAGLVSMEIMNEWFDGAITWVVDIAKKFDMKIISIEDLNCVSNDA